VFFEELEIREPDYNLDIGGQGKEHFHQNADLTVKLIELIRSQSLDPDWIFFLGDSNSVLVAPSLAKEGYKVAHIEAGMRSRDKRMLEEINRIVCDHTSSALFTYHEDYSQNLLDENISQDIIFNVGNTIVEVVNKHSKDLMKEDKSNNQILLDIHRPENFKDPSRLQAIFNRAKELSDTFKVPCLSLRFPRTYGYIDKFNIQTKGIEAVELMSYKRYLSEVYNSLFIISDSGTAQEEPAVLKTPVLVPRDFTERPQSYLASCSKRMSLGSDYSVEDIIEFVERSRIEMSHEWLGDGKSASKILSTITQNSKTK
tara:strand:- start:1828 stop:2769 length:942 start_codon:yes stop_codon:yes gene_type:complete